LSLDRVPFTIYWNTKTVTVKGRKRMVLLPREEKEGGSERGRGLAPQKKIFGAATAPGGKLSAMAGRHSFFRAVYEV